MRYVGIIFIAVVLIAITAATLPSLQAQSVDVPLPQATEEPPRGGGDTDESPGESSTTCEVENRINTGCAPAVAVYTVREFIEVYAIDPQTGNGELLIRFDLRDLGFPPLDTNRTLAETTDPFTGQAVILSYLTSGELQLNAAYQDGKPYIIVWRPNAPANTLKYLAS
jgi:hypothetical protein